MGEGEDEVLVVGVQHPEREDVLVERPMHRFVPEVLERVVHPPHVPFETESEATCIDRTGDTGKRRRLLRNGRDAGMFAVGSRVDLLQERDRFEILIPPIDVRFPLPFVPRVVEAQHRRDAVDTQTVNVVPIEPEIGRRDQERTYLVAPVVEDETCLLYTSPSHETVLDLVCRLLLEKK